METMYNFDVTEDNEIIYTHDEEIINETHDELALEVNNFIQMEDADYYATYLTNTGLDLYKQEFRSEIKFKKSLRYKLIKMLKQLSRSVKNE